MLIIASPLLVLSDDPANARRNREAGAAAVKPSPVQLKGGARSGRWITLPDTWACYPREQERLLDLVFRWVDATASDPEQQRSVVFVCDGSYVGGVASEVQAVSGSAGSSIQQIAVGPFSSVGDPLVRETNGADTSSSSLTFNAERIARLRVQRSAALLAKTPPGT